MESYYDEQLVVDYLKGNKEALEILIKRYLKPVYNFSFRFIGNSQEAEDITQEIFIKVWRNLKKFDQNKKFKTWIFSIAKNTCLDCQKKKRTIPFSELKYIDDSKSFVENIPDTHFLPNELLERIDLTNFLNKVLEKLSPKYRMVLLLRYNDHFTFQEIADALEESINTVKSRYRRGIVLLRKLLT